MYLCVMKRRYVKVAAVKAVEAVAADPVNDIEAVAAVEAVAEVIDYKPGKCFVETRVQRMRDAIASLTDHNEYYGISFDANDEPVLSKVALVGHVAETVQVPVIKDAAGATIE